MNDEVYDALLRIYNQRGYHYFAVASGKKDYKLIGEFLDETAKEHDNGDPQDNCLHTGDEIYRSCGKVVA